MSKSCCGQTTRFPSRRLGSRAHVDALLLSLSPSRHPLAPANASTRQVRCPPVWYKAVEHGRPAPASRRLLRDQLFLPHRRTRRPELTRTFHVPTTQTLSMAPPAKGPASSATSGKQPAKKSLKAVSQKAAKGGDGGEDKKKSKSKSRKESYKT